MKKLLVGIAAIMAVTGAASAADLGGSIKDDPGYAQPSVHRNPTGLYVTGTLGVAEIDRNENVTVDREIGVDVPDSTLIGADTDGDGVISDDERQAVADQLAVFNVPSEQSANGISVPLLADILKLADDETISSTIYGGEVSYLYVPNNSRFGFEFGAGVTGYGDAKSSSVYSGETGEFRGGTALSDADFGGGPICVGLGTCPGDASPFGQSGSLIVDRKYDIDAIARVHYFATPNIAINVGGGLSWAKANIRGENSSDIGGGNVLADGVTTAFNKDDSALGYLLTTGLNYYGDGFVFGVAYEYKHHKFEASDANRASLPIFAGAADIYTESSHSANVEDSVHAVKARLGINLTSMPSPLY